MPLYHNTTNHMRKKRISPEEKEYGFVVPGVVELTPPGLNKALDVGCF